MKPQINACHPERSEGSREILRYAQNDSFVFNFGFRSLKFVSDLEIRNSDFTEGSIWPL
jgi:hypothetical protein